MPHRLGSQFQSSPMAAHQSLAGRVRYFTSTPKPQIDINLDSQGPDTHFHTFGTYDYIQGNVAITPPNDTPFDNLEIHFFGWTKTQVEKLGSVSAVNSKSEAFHPFLRLTQPIPFSAVPQPQIFKAGQTYRLPFTFVLPLELLPTSCRHKTANPKTKDAHLQLPPSLGDAELSGIGPQLLNDMSPEGVKINYAIKVRILRNRDRDDKEMTVAEKTRKIRVVPASEELPPIDIDGLDTEYCLRKEKGLKKGMFKSKVGRLVMEAAQPKSFVLPASDVEIHPATTTTVNVSMRFDPSTPNAQPPRLGSLSCKLKAVTFYSSKPCRDFPSKANIVYDPHQGFHVESLSLSSRNMASVQWHRQEPDTDPSQIFIRRDSAASTSSVSPCPEPSARYSTSNPFYTAQFLVPITLPQNKVFVPTFHTCLASRVYIVEMSLVAHAQGNATSVAPTLTLKVPVQIRAEASRNASSIVASRQNSIAAQMLPDDEFFRPRSIAPPPAEYLRTSSIGQMPPEPEDSSAPPEYTTLPQRRANSVPVFG